MLHSIVDYNQFKEDFKRKFYSVLENYPYFKYFLYDVFLEGTAYVVGGFLRDIVNNQNSKDLDIILGISQKKIELLLTSSSLNYRLNRMGGVKIYFDNFQIDLWSLENNWGFKNNLIKMNEQKIVDNIASGCFYNFDSLVINVLTHEICAKYYNECANNNTLDILRKSIEYKKLNPTIEANILKAFYIHEKFGILFSKDCEYYLIKRLLYIKDNNKSILEVLVKSKKQYSKYETGLTTNILVKNIESLLNINNVNRTFF